MAERKSFLMRIDPVLWRELERWASDELRSVNGQIEYILRDALKKKRSVIVLPTEAATADQLVSVKDLPTSGDER
ncbi:MAG: hypothetical protein FJ160_05490 [Gammaproteobacteria bacterium]|nr:hypothetical protein [Gammaproteobacteria bacterium]